MSQVITITSDQWLIITDKAINNHLLIASWLPPFLRPKTTKFLPFKTTDTAIIYKYLIRTTDNKIE